MSRFLWIVMVVLLLCGCAHAQNTIKVRPVWGSPMSPPIGDPGNPPAHIMEILSEAGDLLGYTLVPHNKQFGTVTIDFVESGPSDSDGRLVIRSRCTKAVRSNRDPEVLAHEIGHAFGLKHSFKEGNLMNPILTPASRNLTDKQRMKMYVNTLKMKLCY